jgi:hypothetical protein
MKAEREAIAEWVRAHATDDEDLRTGSKLLAAFVAAAVRADRAKTAEAAAKEQRIRESARRAMYSGKNGMADELADALSGLYGGLR